MSPALAAFTASIENSMNGAGSGTVSLQESLNTTTVCNSTDGGTISTNSATCTNINEYGGSLVMVPGQSVATTVTLTNTGTAPVSIFSLTPGACTQSAIGSVYGSATDFCSKLDLSIVSGTASVFSGTAATFATSAPITLTTPLAAGASQTYTVTVTLDSTAGNTYQGLKAVQPMTWTASS